MFGSGDVRAKPGGRLGSGLEFVDLVNALWYHIGQEGDEHPEVHAFVFVPHPLQRCFDVSDLACYKVKKQSAHLTCDFVWRTLLSRHK